MIYVIDASVACRFLLVEDLSDKAELVLESFLEGSCDLKAPKLIVYEVGNTLRKAVKQGLISPDEAVEKLSYLVKLKIDSIELDEKMHKSILVWSVKNDAYWQTQVCGAWSGDIGNYISYFIPPKIGNKFILSMEFTPHEFCPSNPNQYGIGLVAHYPGKLTLTLTNAFSKTSGRLQVGWGACVPYPIKMGKTYLIKMLVAGETVMGKVWVKGEPEPDKWMVTDKYFTDVNGKGMGIYCFNTKGEFKNFKIYKISR